MPRKRTKIDETNARALRGQGLSLSEIAKRQGVAKGAVAWLFRVDDPAAARPAKTDASLVDPAAALFAQGVKLNDIKGQLHISMDRLRGIMAAHPDRFPERNLRAAAWTHIDIHAASRNWHNEMSRADMAMAYGVPHRVIEMMTQARRDLFPQRPTGYRSSAAKAANAESSRTRAAKQPRRPRIAVDPATSEATARAAPVATIVGAAPAAVPAREIDSSSEIALPPRHGAFLPLPHRAPVRLADACGCRWPVDPVGDPMGPSLFVCDAPKPVGRPYCDAHRALSRGTGSIGERGAPRIGRLAA